MIFADGLSVKKNIRLEGTEMDLEGKHVAILAEAQYEDLELWYPKLRFVEEKMLVSVVGAGKDVYHSKHGYPVPVDASVEKVDVGGFDAVVIPGGSAPDYMRRNMAMVEFVRKANEQNKVVGAICHGGWMLVSANIIKGKNVTGFYSIKDDLINAGGKYHDSPVVHDHNIITSRVPADLPVFCMKIIEVLAAKHVKVSATP